VRVIDIERARELFGLGPEATREQVKRAFRHKALQTHPDHGGDREDFIEVEAAYRLLLEDLLVEPARSPVSDDNDIEVGLGTRLSVVALSIDGAVIHGKHRAVITLLGWDVVIQVDLSAPHSGSAGSVEVVFMVDGSTDAVHYQAPIFGRSYSGSSLRAFTFQPV